MSGAEPVTMLTDYVLAAVAGVQARGLVRANGARAARLWALAFAVAGAAALLGGTVHGFGFALRPGIVQAVQTGAAMSVGVTGSFLLAGVVLAAVRPGLGQRVLLVLCLVHAVLYVGWLTIDARFRYAVYDALPIGLALLAFLLSRRQGAGAAGVVLAIAGAIVQRTRLGLHPVWFNHNDLCHVLQAAALWLLARAGRTLRDA